MAKKCILDIDDRTWAKVHAYRVIAKLPNLNTASVRLIQTGLRIKRL